MVFWPKSPNLMPTQMYITRHDVSADAVLAQNLAEDMVPPLTANVCIPCHTANAILCACACVWVCVWVWVGGGAKGENSMAAHKF